MHLGNSIICPAVGVSMMAISGLAAVWAYKNAKGNFKKENVLPAICVVALIFALQMINFSIPQTGSSGHIIGAVLLAALLGPYVAFLAICSILIVQSVFFADGGLLALGCNIFNMGVLTCFVAYPLVFKPLAAKNKPILASVLTSLMALQLGSVAVVVQATLSGTIGGTVTSGILNFSSLMMGIHFIIGTIEGVFTATILTVANKIQTKYLSYIFAGTALILAGGISQFASQKPDGLEWSLLGVSDSLVLQTQNTLYPIFEAIQAKAAVLGQMSSSVANIIGVLAVCALMLIINFRLSYEPAKADGK